MGFRRRLRSLPGHEVRHSHSLGVVFSRRVYEESWPFLELGYPERARYNEMYTTWNPSGFDSDAWTSLFAENGLRMFAFTTKHHEGFSMFDTRTRVKNRVDWTAPGGPKIETCDLPYSIME